MHDSVLERVTLRRSLGAKYLTTPAPTKEDYDEALTWAIAAPDHCRLSPARFVVIEERQKFADFFEAGALAEGADQEGAERAQQSAESSGHGRRGRQNRRTQRKSSCL